MNCPLLHVCLHSVMEKLLGRSGHSLESLPLRGDGNSTTEWSSQISQAEELRTRQTRSQTCNKSDAT